MSDDVIAYRRNHTGHPHIIDYRYPCKRFCNRDDRHGSMGRIVHLYLHRHEYLETCRNSHLVGTTMKKIIITMRGL